MIARKGLSVAVLWGGVVAFSAAPYIPFLQLPIFTHGILRNESKNRVFTYPIVSFNPGSGMTVTKSSLYCEPLSVIEPALLLVIDSKQNPILR